MLLPQLADWLWRPPRDASIRLARHPPGLPLPMGDPPPLPRLPDAQPLPLLVRHQVRRREFVVADPALAVAILVSRVLVVVVVVAVVVVIVVVFVLLLVLVLLPVPLAAVGWRLRQPDDAGAAILPLDALHEQIANAGPLGHARAARVAVDRVGVDRLVVVRTRRRPLRCRHRRGGMCGVHEHERLPAVLVIVKSRHGEGGGDLARHLAAAVVAIYPVVVAVFVDIVGAAVVVAVGHGSGRRRRGVRVRRRNGGGHAFRRRMRGMNSMRMEATITASVAAAAIGIAFVAITIATSIIIVVTDPDISTPVPDGSRGRRRIG